MSHGTDRIALPPADAEKTNLVCHFCIVGCGYHVYKWPANREGGRAPGDNALGVDFRKQVPPMQLTMTSAMTTRIRERDGQDYRVMILPDDECVVNEGLSSTRGGQLANVLYGDTPVASHRLRYPRLNTGDDWVDTTREHAADLYAAITQRVLDSEGPDGVMFNCSDHGGAGGGFEFTWGTGKLMFQAIGTKMARIHNRPAYNSECHASRDMGMYELNSAYEDAELADVIWSIGNNPYENQTNYFLAHWVPNLRGQTRSKKRERFPDETVDRGRVIFVDPRRTPSVAVCDQIGDADNVLHLQINPGTDTALFNAIFTYVIDQGWHNESFIADHTSGFEEAREANRMSLEEASQITGVSIEAIRRAAEWSYKPKDSGHAPRTLHHYEKGIIWGNDNYRIQASLVDIVLATGNVGREGTGISRMGGHQEGYTRPPYPGPRPAPYIDQEIIKGNGQILTVWGCNAFQTTCNAEQYKEAIHRRAGIVQQAMAKARGGSVDSMADAVHEATQRDGGLFIAAVDLYPTAFARAGHLMLPAAHPGEIELTAMNGERRIRLSERFMDPPGEAEADSLIAARLANALRRRYQEAGNEEMAERFAGFDWESQEDAFNDGFRMAHEKEIDSQGGGTGRLVTYQRLREAGNNGVQLPVQEYKDGELVGTPRLYSDHNFDTDDGRARFQPAPWNGFLSPVAKQKEKYPLWVNNGRTNHIWQSAYHDQHIDYRTGRFPMAPLEINPEDAEAYGIANGDVVELFNDYGSTMAMAYRTPEIKTGQLFMMFGYFNGMVGEVTTEAVDENVVPYYKGAWADIRRIGSMEEYQRSVSFRSRRYT
ncbi:MAG: arsenate reductase (azurin) large subunit [Ectothiorhodospiraceae bacterium]